MDDFIDPFLSSPSWSDMNASARSSWVGTVASQTNSLLADSMEVFGGDEKNPSTSLIPSSHIMGDVVAEDLGLNAHDDTSSIFTNENLKYLSQHELPNHRTHPPQHDNETHERNLSLQGVIESNSTAGSYGPELNTSCSISLPHRALTMSNSIETNGSEPSSFPQSLGDAHSISSVPTMWPSSYSGVSSLIGQGKLQGFGFQGLEADADILRKTHVENGKYQNLSSLTTSTLRDQNELHNSLSTFTAGQQIKLTASNSQPHQEQNELRNLGLHSFATGPQMTLNKTAGIQNHQQLSQSIEGNTLKNQMNHPSNTQTQAASANGGGCSGAAKPRVRARRGQATDPHSIAERLRREKIAERMKNLQELVPNSNKTDKASMLDEIIDYVKFLQLQVKVLSMSRLGAAGAVVPLITDVQAEGSGTLHLSSVGQGGADLSETQDNLAFEQEVVKLMESNVTTAMQYLQNKGLCLMPIALAAAISSQKGSTAAIPPDRRKPEVSHSVISQSNGQGFAESNGCNGQVVKREEVKELKPKS